MKQNYMQVVKPDYFIHIGIKDGRVVSTDWSEVIKNLPPMDNDKMMKTVINHLDVARLRLQK